MKDIILSGFLNGGAGGGSAGVTSWNDLKDKPFGEGTTLGDTLTWDGDTNGRVSVIDGLYYHVSDSVPALDDFRNGCTVVYHQNMWEDEDEYIELEVPFEMIQESYQENGFVMFESFFVIPTDNYVVYDIVLPKAGIYLMYQGGTDDNGNLYFHYQSSLTIPGCGKLTGTTVTPIDEKFIPKSIARKTDIPQHTWEALPDKPFYRSVKWRNLGGSYIEHSTWEDHNGVLKKSLAGMSFLDEYLYTREQSIPEALRLVIRNNQYGTLSFDYEFQYNYGEYTVDGIDDLVGFYGNLAVASMYHNNPPKQDSAYCIALSYDRSTNTKHFILYAPNEPCYTDTVNTLTAIDLMTRSVTKESLLDSKFLPKLPRINSLTSAPTAEDFNNLLIALRRTGYME